MTVYMGPNMMPMKFGALISSTVAATLGQTWSFLKVVECVRNVSNDVDVLNM